MYSRRGLVSNYSLKRKRERLKLRLLFFIVIFFLACVGIVALSYLPQIRINEIEVSGVKLISATDIEKEARGVLTGNHFLVFPKNNIFLYPKKDIEIRITDDQAIDSVEVSIKNLHSIRIEVMEREPAALWCGDAGNCYLVSTKGLIFEPAPSSTPATFVRFSGGINREPLGTPMLSVDDMRRTLSFIHTLAAETDLHVESVTLKESSVYEGVLTIGTKIIWSGIQDLSGALLNLKLLLDSPEFKEDQKKKDIEYIDIQNVNKVFYKPR
jgi:hypothetical protein